MKTDSAGVCLWQENLDVEIGEVSENVCVGKQENEFEMYGPRI